MRIITIILISLFYASQSFSKDAETTKEIWSVLMLGAIPEQFCSTETYFSDCFKLSNNDCKYFISVSANNCIKKYDSEIPDIMNKAMGTKWGGIIGYCTGSIFETALTQEGKKIDSKECSDFESWKRQQ